MPRPALILALTLLGAGAMPGPASAGGYYVPAGKGSYFLSLSARPPIEACGWAATGITAGPEVIRYNFRHGETGVNAAVILAHASTCLEVVQGPGAAFCLTSTVADDFPATDCGPALLAAEISAGIQESEASFVWKTPRSAAPEVPTATAQIGDLPAEPIPSTHGEFSLYLLALVAFVALRLRGWRMLREGYLHLRDRERQGLLAILLLSTVVSLGVYGDPYATMWAQEAVFSSGSLLRMPSDPATALGLDRALLSSTPELFWRQILSQAIGGLGLLYAFALALGARCSPRLALVLTAFLGLSPLYGRFAAAEPGFLLALTLGLATVHAAAAWVAAPSTERLWLLGTAYIAGAWLVVGPSCLLGVPLLLLLHPLGERPSSHSGRLAILAGLLGLTLLLGIRTAVTSLQPLEIAAAEHRTPLGIILHYHLAQPILAVLGLLGLAVLLGLRGARLLLGGLGLAAALIFALGAVWGSWSSLPVLFFVGLPLLLLSGAGLVRAARWLPERGPARPLIVAATLLLLLHHTLLFHGTFGRLLFS